MVRLPVDEVEGVRVLPLAEFATGADAYDGERLNAKHPGVKAILRVSQVPAIGHYAIVPREKRRITMP